MKPYQTLALGGALALALAACSSDMAHRDSSAASTGTVRPSSSEGGNTGTSGSIGTSGTTPAGGNPASSTTTDTPPHQ
jgi:hypothetical protein